MRHLFLIDEQEVEAGLLPADAGYRLLLGDADIPVALADGRLTVAGRSEPVAIALEGDVAHIHLDGRAWRVEFVDAVERYAHTGHAGADDLIIAPMPGSVVAVNVAAGDSVAAGQVLLVIESMKLETAIKAPRAGTIDAVHVAQAATFNKGAPLVALAPAIEG
jgi:biotin carboxyl carrier protein